MAFRIERNDITKVHTEAIVNTANPMPEIGEGTDAAIYNAAGADLLIEERKKIGMIEKGQSAYTPGFRLFSNNGIRYIIHTVGTVWIDGNHGEIEVLRSCYKNSLNLAKELMCKSISIPLLASGNYGYPKALALNVALDEINRFLLENDMEVVLVVYDSQALNISEKLFADVKTFIDENYIEEQKKCNKRNSLNSQIADNRKKREYRQKLIESDGEIGSALQNCKLSVMPEFSFQEEDSADLSDLLEKTKKNLNFQDTLRKYINEKNLDNPTVYKRSIIVDKKLFSKIMCGHIPGKHSVMALGLALELDLSDYENLLATASYALNPSDMFDTIVKYCVINKEYNVMQVDTILFNFGQPCFVEQ